MTSALLSLPATGSSCARGVRSMKRLLVWLAAVAVSLGAGGIAWADTFASSAIFNSFSASVGSVSTSFNASSDASSPGRPLRVGEYRVMQIAAAPGREGYAQLTLRALPAAGEAVAAASKDDHTHDYTLYLPQETVARAALAEGQVISAAARPYGLELAKATNQAREPFFLVVSDERYRELQTRPVTL
jgi:hypothetical protein